MKIGPLLSYLLLVLVLSGAGFAQSNRVEIPGDTMRQVVTQILRSRFKDRKTPETIEILDRWIEASWLPEIDNVSFVLVQKGQFSGDIYFFTEPRKSASTYEIGFGHGDPFCSATGETWKFRPTKRGVKIWFSGGFGTGCGGGEGSGSGGGSSNHSETDRKP